MAFIGATTATAVTINLQRVISINWIFRSYSVLVLLCAILVFFGVTDKIGTK
jgi:hypothetical protein